MHTTPDENHPANKCRSINRRDFVKGTALASAASLAFGGESLQAEDAAKAPLPPLAASKNTLPMGKIGKVEFSRLMLGGNLIGGYAHSRDLHYVAVLARRYNTEAKILETLEAAEINGINTINLPVFDDCKFLQTHWKRGGKMKWIAQAKVGPDYDLDSFQMAIDQGATGIHMQGHQTERMFEDKRLDVVGKSVQMCKKQGVLVGIGAHSLEVIKACEDAKLGAEFYVKTLHSLHYPTAPHNGEVDKWGLGKFDNCWCNNPDEVIKYFADIKIPWIAFKVMAAGAIAPRQAFPYAFNSGADFVLAGMFDWQVESNVAEAQRVLSNVKRTRPWCS